MTQLAQKYDVYVDLECKRGRLAGMRVWAQWATHDRIRSEPMVLSTFGPGAEAEVYYTLDPRYDLAQLCSWLADYASAHALRIAIV